MVIEALQREAALPERSGPAAAVTEPVGTRPAAAPLAGDTVVLLLADIAPAWRAWGWWRIARGAQGFRGLGGLHFAKALGSGHEGGFGLRPSASRQGAFLVFADEAAADAFLQQGTFVRRLRERSREMALLKLQAWSVRGSWAGHSPGCAAQRPDAAELAAMPVAALTRASIRPARAAAFWRHAPPSQQALQQAAGCRLAVGLGEAPVLRQATFSLWDSVAAMDAYARSGAHGQAIRASVQGQFFSESMFVRFRLLAAQGQWQGVALG